jgi:hypothetical protein
MTASPRVALVLSTFNALPHLRLAIEGIMRQSYRELRLIVQDGGSTDGTVEYLRGLDCGFPIDVDSRRDSGVAQAYARAIARATEPYVMTVAADEVLAPDAVQVLLDRHLEIGDAVVVYGSMDIVDRDRAVIQHFQPQAFDFRQIMECVTVPPMSTCMFNRAAIGVDFRFDETLTTCPDYEFWLRIGGRFDAGRFVVMTNTIAEALGDRTSMSFRPEAHVQFAKDKSFALRRFLAARIEDSAARLGAETRALRGIHCWAAEMMLSLGGVTPAVYDMLRAALLLGPPDARLAALLSRSLELEIWSRDPLQPYPEPASPPTIREPTRTIVAFDLGSGYVGADWGSTVRVSDGVEIAGGPSPWSYAWQLPLDVPDTEGVLWLRVGYRVLAGSPAMSLMIGQSIYDETVFAPAATPDLLHFRIFRGIGDITLLVRNSSEPGGAVLIERVELVTRAEAPKPGFFGRLFRAAGSPA